MINQKSMLQLFKSIKLTRFGSRGEQGFILPVTILLTLMLVISALSFMQMDFIERVSIRNNVNNQAAFYLASGGLERARQSFKIDTSGNEPTWTPILQDLSIRDLTPDPDLCPDPARGCVIPPFQLFASNPLIAVDGDPVISPDIPFAGTFDEGFYEVRAFNDLDAGAPDEDTNGILIFRALGMVRDERKLLELSAFAVSGVRLINCLDDGAIVTCPDVKGHPGINPAPGKEPAILPALPEPDPALSDPASIYRDPAALGLTDCSPAAGDVVFDESGDAASVQMADGCYYFVDGNARVQNIADYNNIVIFAMGEFDLTGTTHLVDAMLISIGALRLNGGVTIEAPLPYPALMSETLVYSSDKNVEIFGAIYSGGVIDLNPITVHGVIIGDSVELQGTSTDISDDHDTDPDFIKYYALIPGFSYPEDLLTTIEVKGSWLELE